MSFAAELLDLAQHLANMEGEPPRQACLRRAVSTAYYALFHLLISEATRNWARAELRPALGRVFEHGTMKSASEKKNSALNEYFKKNPPESPELEVARHLRTVVKIFIQSQERRNDADYNTSKDWTHIEVQTQIDFVSDAFESWQAIRDEPVAQAYLVSLLGKERSHA
jgi:uncharacterized protein (UPF0332 family)